MKRICLLAVLAGCSSVEYAYHRSERVDVFRQTRQRAVDLLLVIDNSCSMAGEQDHLARSFESLIAALETGDTDWRVAATTSEPALTPFRARLSGGTDEIVVVGPSGDEIDRVAYDDTHFPIARGVALERCDPTRAGDDPAAWTPADGFPTPGAPNPCDVPSSALGTDRGPRAPERGDLVVSEFLPWSDGDDSGCEWIELANTTPDTLDLTGVWLADDGRNAAGLPDGTTMGPGARRVVGRSEDPIENCGTPVDVVLDAPFILAQGERWIDRETPNAAEVFSELVAVGTGAFGLEMGMENAILTLSEPANPETDAGFLREDADLAVVFFSDEDDLSPSSVADYLDRFRMLKGDAGYREPDRVRIGAAVGLDPADGVHTCTDADPIYAARYLALVEASGGTAWSICDDLTRVADQAGVTFSAQRLSFALSAVPALETLEAVEYGSYDEASRVGPMVRDVDYTLVEAPFGDEALWMVFPQDRVPPGGVVVVTYEALPDTATVDLGGGA